LNRSAPAHCETQKKVNTKSAKQTSSLFFPHEQYSAPQTPLPTSSHANRKHSHRSPTPLWTSSKVVVYGGIRTILTLSSLPIVNDGHQPDANHHHAQQGCVRRAALFRQQQSLLFAQPRCRPRRVGADDAWRRASPSPALDHNLGGGIGGGGIVSLASRFPCAL